MLPDSSCFNRISGSHTPPPAAARAGPARKDPRPGSAQRPQGPGPDPAAPGLPRFPGAFRVLSRRRRLATRDDPGRRPHARPRPAGARRHRRERISHQHRMSPFMLPGGTVREVSPGGSPPLGARPEGSFPRRAGWNLSWPASGRVPRPAVAGHAVAGPGHPGWPGAAGGSGPGMHPGTAAGRMRPGPFRAPAGAEPARVLGPSGRGLPGPPRTGGYATRKSG